MKIKNWLNYAIIALLIIVFFKFQIGILSKKTGKEEFPCEAIEWGKSWKIEENPVVIITSSYNKDVVKWRMVQFGEVRAEGKNNVVEYLQNIFNFSKRQREISTAVLINIDQDISVHVLEDTVYALHKIGLKNFIINGVLQVRYCRPFEVRKGEKGDPLRSELRGSPIRGSGQTPLEGKGVSPVE